MAVVLKGIEVANAIKGRYTTDVDQLKAQGITPTLGIVRVGERPDDLAYERSIIKRCEGMGIAVHLYQFDSTVSDGEFKDAFTAINFDAEIDGILVFRPLPKQIDERAVCRLIDPRKDVDGMSPTNIAGVFAGERNVFAPCTAQAVVEVMDHYQVPIEGSAVAIVGRSMVVGRPLAMLLMQRNATVTICHTRTKQMEEVCRRADVVVAAAGKPRMIGSGCIHPGATVIDVGINVDEDGAMCGDVDFAAVEQLAGQITPVPGGVGSVTTAVLAKHVIQAALNRP